jgi:hypothetical protein
MDLALQCLPVVTHQLATGVGHLDKDRLGIELLAIIRLQRPANADSVLARHVCPHAHACGHSPLVGVLDLGQLLPGC